MSKFVQEYRFFNDHCRLLSLGRKHLGTPFGLLRVFSVVIPFLYVGTQISKNFAALLEEHDIFVPEDDDDDD
uniref:Essential MCU regulator, mitochondrial n=1 Tax=Calidris pygmaea TaxID=425635 RepID=A0A8C3JHM6_9CHAR